MPTLFIKQTGNINNPPLILLHGWGFQHRIWDDFVPFFSHEFSLYQVDLFGYGNSEMIAPYSLENIVEQLITKLPQNALWIGWSLGGLIAQAVAFQTQIKGLFLIGSSPRFVQTENWHCAMLEITLEKFALQLEQDWAGTLQRFLVLQLQGDEQSRYWLKKLRQQLQEVNKPHLHALKAGLSLLKNTDLRDFWRQRIPCPTFLCFGRRDALVPAGLSDAWKSLNPSIESLVIEGAAHTPFLSHSTEVSTALRRFWNEIR